MNYTHHTFIFVSVSKFLLVFQLHFFCIPRFITRNYDTFQFSIAIELFYTQIFEMSLCQQVIFHNCHILILTFLYMFIITMFVSKHLYSFIHWLILHVSENIEISPIRKEKKRKKKHTILFRWFVSYFFLLPKYWKINFIAFVIS